MARNPRQPRRPTVSENGGHTALTPARQATIVENISKGAHIEVAARAAGVSKEAFRRWWIAGEDKVDPESGDTTPAPEPYRGFRVAIEDAEAALELRAVDAVFTGSMALPFGNTQGLYTFLARRFRQRWTPKDTIEISGPSGGPIEVKGDDVDRLAGTLEALARAGVIALPGDPNGVPEGADPVDE